MFESVTLRRPPLLAAPPTRRRRARAVTPKRERIDLRASALMVARAIETSPEVTRLSWQIAALRSVYGM